MNSRRMNLEVEWKRKLAMTLWRERIHFKRRTVDRQTMNPQQGIPLHPNFSVSFPKKERNQRDIAGNESFSTNGDARRRQGDFNFF